MIAEKDFSGGNMEDSLHPLKVQVSEGNEAAFRRLFDLYFPRLSEFAYSIVKSEEVATDMVDEVFVRLWHHHNTILSIDNLRVYLYRAVKNSALNYLSRKAHQGMFEPFDDIKIQLKEDINPERLMITREMLQKIRDAVEALPPRCRMVFKLVREDGLKYGEVADILNLSIHTVDAQMVIAVSRIREALKAELDFRPKKNLQKK